MKRHVVLAATLAAVLVAATHALSRVYTGGSWRPVTLLAAGLALGLAALCRRAGLGTVVAAAVSAAGLTAFTVVVHLPGAADTSTWAEFTGLLERGLRQFQDEPSPTAPLEGLMLLTTTGTWLVAHAAHELLARAGRPMAALMPPTVLWAVPLSVPLPPGRTWPHALPFLAAGALLLLVAARRDGHQEGRTLAPQPAGAALGGAALAVAALLSGLTPGYGSEPWVDRAGSSTPRGYQPIVDVGDRLHLPEPRDVLEVRADRRLYLRLAALDTFDGTTWRLGPAGAGTYRPPAASLHPTTRDLPPEVVIARSEQVQAHVEVLDLENIYVPVPYQPVRVTGPARDHMVYSTVGGFVATTTTDGDGGERLVAGVRPGFQYGVVAQVPDPAAVDLQGVEADPASVRRWLELPSDYPELAAVTRAVLERAGATTQLDKALAVQDHFVGPDSDYAYTTDVDSLRGSAALRDFVVDTRAGYCEYFATAMAVMLRTAGVPARVAVGFLGGREVDSTPASAPLGLNTYRVSTSDAHAWVEVLFPGHGWIRFEPTPRSDGSVQVPTRSDLDPLLTRQEQQRRGIDTAESSQQPQPSEDLSFRLDDPATLDDGFESPSAPVGGSTASLLVIAGVLLVLAAAGAALVAAAWRRWPGHPDLDDRERVLAAQDHLQRRAAGYGIGRRTTETAREVAARWVGEGRTGSRTAGDFTRLAQSAAFATDVTAGAGAEAEHLAATLVEDLRTSVSRVDRMVAPVRMPLRSATATARRIAVRARNVAGADRT